MDIQVAGRQLWECEIVPIELGRSGPNRLGMHQLIGNSCASARFPSCGEFGTGSQVRSRKARKAKDS
jgi:hypothetical protein